MKKTKRKLELTTETIRNLTRAQLEHANGGTYTRTDPCPLPTLIGCPKETIIQTRCSVMSCTGSCQGGSCDC